MKKGLGLRSQKRGHKRRAKNIARKRNHITNLEYIVKLMKKYGSDIKLNESPIAGTKYLEEYLRPTKKVEDGNN
jgi:hypothetical protein